MADNVNTKDMNKDMNKNFGQTGDVQQGQNLGKAGYDADISKNASNIGGQSDVTKKNATTDVDLEDEE